MVDAFLFTDILIQEAVLGKNVPGEKPPFSAPIRHALHSTSIIFVRYGRILLRKLRYLHKAREFFHGLTGNNSVKFRQHHFF